MYGMMLNVNLWSPQWCLENTLSQMGLRWSAALLMTEKRSAMASSFLLNSQINKTVSVLTCLTKHSLVPVPSAFLCCSLLSVLSFMTSMVLLVPCFQLPLPGKRYFFLVDSPGGWTQPAVTFWSSGPQLTFSEVSGGGGGGGGSFFCGLGVPLGWLLSLRLPWVIQLT